MKSGRPHRAREQMAQFLRQNTGFATVGEFLDKHKRLALPDFLAEVQRTGVQAALASPGRAKDAEQHLLTQWPTTVIEVARPQTLPAVTSRREKVRVHPAAPWSTAAVASGGTTWVLASGLSTPVEILGVVALTGVTALGASAFWRPRARRQDRHFTLQGTPALVARAEEELAANGLLALAAAPDSEEHLGHLLGAARELEELEADGHRIGMLSIDGALRHPPRTPPEQALAEELVARRLDVVHAVVQLGQAGHEAAAQRRAERRSTYRADLD